METVETVLKPFLTLREFAAFLGRPYPTVWKWVNEGRVATERKESENGHTSYRVPREAAEEAKKRLDDGLWV